MTPVPLPDPDYHALFAAAPGLYLVLDPAFRIVAVNDAYAAGTMTRREDILGRGIFEVFPDNPDDPAAAGVRNLRASLERVRLSGQPDAMPVQKYDIPSPAGAGGGFIERYWSPLNTPVRAADGTLRYIIHRVEDVTEFMRLQQKDQAQGQRNEALQAAAGRMEAEIYARASEVAEASARLKEANGELARLYEKTRELDEMKTQLFANVSHELRTPLTLILGPVRALLERADVDAPARHALATVERNAQLLQRHVNDLLDVARLEAGAVVMRYSAIDLAALCRFVAGLFDSQIGERGIRLALDLPASLPAEIDEEKVERILLNLLANAFRFSPDGGTLRLRLRRVGGEARLLVADDGPGVPAELRQAVFERFRQVPNAGTQAAGGTGLGLAIVKEFTGLLGGRVAVRRSPGGGALFRLVLPLRAPAGSRLEAATRPAALASQRAASALPPPAAGTPRAAPSAAPQLLIVEDNADMAAYLAELLAPHYRLAHADSGAAGLQQALAAPPDLILTDAMMPGSSGEDLVRAARRDEGLVEVPILMLTARADDRFRVHMLRLGAQDFLLKPFVAEELLARVAGLLAQRAATVRQGVLAHHLNTAQEAERKALAAGLHDRASANLAALQLTLRNVRERSAAARADELEPLLDDIQAIVQDTTQDIRELSTDLRPALLDYFGLHQALDGYIRQFGQRTGIAVSLKCEQTKRPVPALETVIFRIVQEALTNCARHAQASRIAVDLGCEGEAGWHLTIEDDGIGLAGDALGAGLGVQTMRERAALFDGQLSIGPAAGGGTRIEARFPMSGA